MAQESHAFGDAPCILAFDTANEVIAIGVGVLDGATRTIECIKSQRIEAHRSSNTKLLPSIDALLQECGIDRSRIACVASGRGPGSFTGVRICIATAKGVASALEVPLVGVSTLDAIAWRMQMKGMRGDALVLADAMRKEVYPVPFNLTDDGVERLCADNVVKAQVQAERMGNCASAASDGSATAGTASADGPVIAGDALEKYADLYAACGTLASKDLWTPTGSGLLAAAQAAWKSGEIDPFDAVRHDPAFLLPVYTRLSDAEENERRRLAHDEPRNLHTGVQHVGVCSEGEQQLNVRELDTTVVNAKGNDAGIVYRPLDAANVDQAVGLENHLMGSDAWNRNLILDDIARPDRSWWAAEDETSGHLIGYAGGWTVDGKLQILKVAVVPEFRRRGIARELLSRVASDGRDLGAGSATLEVRASNSGAQALYGALGFHSVGKRPHYYSDREDAIIMDGPLPIVHYDVAGMTLQVDRAAVGVTEKAMLSDTDAQAAVGQAPTSCTLAEDVSLPASHPLILAIESSCDETAASVIDGDGNLLSDVVASQIDFHARFGGVVPEIASRKHVEAICGVAQVCLESAAERLGASHLRWRDLDAVAATYTPGLVGALVVGVAFAKAAAWGANIPFIGVNHMEGHLYANKIAQPDIAPPMVVSLVSGGHTMLVHVRDWGAYRVLGSTVDDAVGEAFDKVAKALGLGYPGGPVISQLAAAGNPRAIAFPRAMMHSGDLRFSLSGLKTAVVTYINQQKRAGAELNLPDIAASFQAAVIDVQVAKAATALQQTGAREFCLGGGVAANPALRKAYEHECAKRGVRLTMPPLSACTDNAAMIALVALDRYREGRFFGLEADAYAHCDLEQPY